jgi:hypothetical protein
LAFGARVFEDPDVAILPTIRLGDEEERFKATGYVDGKLYGHPRLARRGGADDLGAKEQCG